MRYEASDPDEVKFKKLNDAGQYICDYYANDQRDTIVLTEPETLTVTGKIHSGFFQTPTKLVGLFIEVKDR
jgi:hypothetical protein